MTHAYERSLHSAAGNCHCGHAEHSRAHPHAHLQWWKSELCVCAWPVGHPIHIDAATARPQPVRVGLAGVAAAVRDARGGDAPAPVRGFA